MGLLHFFWPGSIEMRFFRLIIPRNVKVRIIFLLRLRLRFFIATVLRFFGCITFRIAILGYVFLLFSIFTGTVLVGYVFFSGLGMGGVALSISVGMVGVEWTGVLFVLGRVVVVGGRCRGGVVVIGDGGRGGASEGGVVI